MPITVPPLYRPAFALALTLSAAVAVAGPERIAFPAGYKDGVLYTTVDRADIKQYRELYAPAAAVRAAKEGKPLPNGTVLTLVQYKAQTDAQGLPLKDAAGRFVKGELVAYTVMAKGEGWGGAYPEEMRNGDWEYSVFNAEGRFNDKANFKSCFECHKPHAGQDYVISMASLAGRFPSAAATPAAGPGDVVIGSFAFAPGKLAAVAGKPVRFINGDDSPHQVVVKGKPVRTRVLLKGESETLAFDEPGTYNFSCALHPGMKGVVEVGR